MEKVIIYNQKVLEAEAENLQIEKYGKRTLNSTNQDDFSMEMSEKLNNIMKEIEVTNIKLNEKYIYIFYHDVTSSRDNTSKKNYKY